MNEIKRYEWDFGDGVKSDLKNPFHIYKSPGMYTVSLAVTFADGKAVKTTKEQYIKVYSTSETMIIGASNRERVSLVYGTDKTNGTGWSLFTGEDWVFPESTASIIDVEINGDALQIMFDENGRPFTISDKKNPVYRDKIGFKQYDENGVLLEERHPGTSISCYVITPEYVGENSSFRLSHEQTFFDMVPITKTVDFISDTVVSTQLIHNGKISYEQNIPYVNTGKEQLFSIKKRADRVQVGIKTNESGLKILGIETSLKVSDVARYSSGGETVDFAFQMFIMSPIVWVSRWSNGFDVISQTILLSDTDPVFGVDNNPDSGLLLKEDVTIALTGSTSISFFSKNYSPPSDFVVHYTKDVGDYTFYVLTYVDVDTIEFESGVTLFDIRVMTDTITTLELYDEYIHDVVENDGIKFLPGA
jgi:PKD repeat protein